MTLKCQEIVDTIARWPSWGQGVRNHTVLCFPVHLLFSPPSLPLSHVFLGVAGTLQACEGSGSPLVL